MPQQLADDRVRLRPFAEADAASVFAACRDPDIRHFTVIPDARDVEDTRAWIRSQQDMRARGESLDLAITSRHDGALVGAVGLGPVDFAHRRAPAGYWVAPEARGHGFAAAALRLLAGWAITGPLGLARVELHIDAGNVASLVTAERAGFTREGVLRSYMEVKGRRWDVAIYALVAREA